MPLPSDSSTTGSHALNGAGRGLSRCRFPTPSSNRPQIASQSRVWVFSPKRVCPSPKGGGAGYCVSWVGWVGPACSQLGHTGPTGLVWGFGGVVPLPGLQNRTQGHTGASLVFLRRTSLPLPLKGGGAGYRLSWVGRVGPARSQPGHVGPTGPVWAFAGVVSLPCPLTGHKSPYRAELGFTAFSWCASSAEVPQAGTPGGNSPHREWEGSYKAASRFSQCRLMSTPLSARFR